MSPEEERVSREDFKSWCFRVDQILCNDFDEFTLEEIKSHPCVICGVMSKTIGLGLDGAFLFYCSDEHRSWHSERLSRILEEREREELKKFLRENCCHFCGSSAEKGIKDWLYYVPQVVAFCSTSCRDKQWHREKTDAWKIRHPYYHTPHYKGQ